MFCAGGLARADGSFDDFRNLGLLEDRRREASPLRVGGHTLDPAFNYKLFGVTTPHAFAAVGGGYTDNLLRGDHDAPGLRLRREAYGYTEGGLRLDTQLSDHRLELEYRAAVQEFADSGDFDTLQQSARARLDLYAVDVEGHLDASWRRLRYPTSIQLTGQLALDQYRLSGYSEARLWRFGLRVGGSAVRDDYSQRGLDYLDSWTYRADVQVYGRIVPKLRALLEYNWIVVEFDEGRSGFLNDFQAHQVRAGIDGSITPKLNASIKLGYNRQDVDRVGFRDRREFSGFVAEVSAGYRPFQPTTVNVAYSRTLDVSVQSNFLVSDQVSISVDQQIFTTINVGGSFTYTRSDVSRVAETTAHLNRIETRVFAGWKPRGWISTRVEYRFVRLNSEFPNNDYREHSVLASVAVGL